MDPIEYQKRLFQTNESLITVSGYHVDAPRIRAYDILLDTTAIELDSNYFSAKEVREIDRSLSDFRLGNYKVSNNTEEIFADLDSE